MRQRDRAREKLRNGRIHVRRETCGNFVAINHHYSNFFKNKHRNLIKKPMNKLCENSQIWFSFFLLQDPCSVSIQQNWFICPAENCRGRTKQNVGGVQFTWILNILIYMCPFVSCYPFGIVGRVSPWPRHHPQGVSMLNFVPPKPHVCLHVRTYNRLFSASDCTINPIFHPAWQNYARDFIHIRGIAMHQVRSKFIARPLIVHVQLDDRLNLSFQIEIFTPFKTNYKP